MSEGDNHLSRMPRTGGDPKSEPSPSSKIESSIIESMIWPFHSFPGFICYSTLPYDSHKRVLMNTECFSIEDVGALLSLVTICCGLSDTFCLQSRRKHASLKRVFSPTSQKQAEGALKLRFLRTPQSPLDDMLHQDMLKTLQDDMLR